MAKFMDKTMDEWEDIAEQWHNDESTKISLPEYMGLDETEYLRYMHNITETDLSDKEVKEEALKRGREAVVGLTLTEMFGGS